MCEKDCQYSYFDIIRLTNVEILDFLIKPNVIRYVVNCGKCGEAVQLDRENLQFRCTKVSSTRKQKKQKCTFRKSARTGTFLEKTHLTPRQVVEIIATLLHLKPPRHDLLMENVGIASHTVVAWYSFFREVLVDDAIGSSEILGGPGSVVEIDEAKFGRRKFNRGRIVEGQWVFGGIERGSGRRCRHPSGDFEEMGPTRNHCVQ
jgi:hypothetical protein